MLEVLLGVIAVLLIIILSVLLRRGAGEAELVQQQLIELRSRLDDLVGAQQEVPKRLAEGSIEQLRSLADLREQLGRLTDATERLESMGRAVADVQELLKVPKLRGTLGEVWLEELLRQVFPARLYETQYSFRSGEKVDAVLKVGQRLVPIDSKFPLEACQRMLSADGEQAERERRVFRRTLRERIDEIADKYVRPDEGTYEFAFMYIPAENVYYEAVVRGEELEDGRSIVAYALYRRVIPVSPNTFYAYLAAVLHGLRGLEVEQRAREILAALSGLHQQLTRFQRTHELVGKHIDNAVRQYDESDKLLVRIWEQFQEVTGLRDQPELQQEGGERGEEDAHR
ncbi:MAG: DNA recombination protein RmuC [Gemmatimonadales bacterium]|nr:DNA recombination protein RmuC [Gemmatimonadales bacterium]NIN12928.1 DNA recombination protein RmuC [Gemmatimonadales bacterium]NIR02216.1 DNA recombination protein RmuC [Gemmatimonadales bacterium]NIS66008.1 DNA recombination protein RmuC [Gemmatimonadales bacterium]